MPFYASVSPKEVHDRASGLVQQFLKFKDFSRQCLSSTIISVLFYAASRMTSLSEACARLRGAPSDETLRQALLATLPDAGVLEKQINRALVGDLPKALRKRKQPIAIDVHDVPYYGQPAQQRAELCRGKPQRGTCRFHSYATAYVVRKGCRFTLALTWVRREESLVQVLQRLLAQLHKTGVKVRYLLLDRGFYSVEVVRYLQRSRVPFLMPAKCAGRTPKDPARSTGIRRFFHWKHSGWGQHCWRNPSGQQATVHLCVCCRNLAGRWKKRGRQPLVYAYWGFRPGDCHWVRETYRQRFGIESSYRQMNQARIRTSSRDPLRRLLFVGLALILRNVWVWFHLVKLAIRRGTGLTLRLALLRFRAMLLQLQELAQSYFDAFLTNSIQVLT
jgi:putative transposase